MHKSQLAGFIIDCDVQDLDAAADFWSQALGYARQASAPDETNYVALDAESAGLVIEVQRVTHPSRVHIDIETDDIEAEVKRLEELGAQRVEQRRTWWVMEAPTGQRFCVVRPQTAKFEQQAKSWS